MDFEQYLEGYLGSADELINIMVGDLQRIRVYTDKGFQIPQEITSEAQEAYRKLVELGFTQHLIEE